MSKFKIPFWLKDRLWGILFAGMFLFIGYSFSKINIWYGVPFCLIAFMIAIFTDAKASHNDFNRGVEGVLK